MDPVDKVYAHIYFDANQLIFCERPSSRRIRGYLCDGADSEIVYSCYNCNSQFISGKEFKYHISQEFCTKLDQLDVNCMDHIFKYLSANDLAAMSLTSERYKYMARKFFHNNCKTEPILIKQDVISKIAKFNFRTFPLLQ